MADITNPDLFKVVGPGLVSTSPAFVSSSASHPAGPHARHAQKTVNVVFPIPGETSIVLIALLTLKETS